MPKTYDFRVVVRRAEFSGDLVSTFYGSRADGYAEICIEATLDDAIAKRAEMSAAEGRPHTAFLSMKYRDDRIPPGFKLRSSPIYGGTPCPQ